MSSMVAGNTIGSAKKAPITMARVSNQEDEQQYFPERTIDALAMVYDDIMEKDSASQSVVSMSWGIDDDLPNQVYINALTAAYTYLVNAFVKQNILLVVAAGQDGNATPIDDVSILSPFVSLANPTAQPVKTLPATLGKNIKEMTVVGAVDNDGNPYEGGRWQPDIVEISAPGVQVRCAVVGGYDNTVDGTSPCE